MQLWFGISLALTMIFMVGCADFKILQREIAPDGTIRETEIEGKTFFDSGNTLAKARTTMTEKTQGVSLSGFDQDASGSNAVSLAEKVVEAAVKGAVKGAVP